MSTRRRLLQTAGAAAAAGLIGYRPSLGHAQPTSPKPDKLVVITASTFGPTIETFAQQWTAQTGVPVEVISQSYDTTYTKIVSALAGGAPTDIVMVDSIWTGTFAQAGFLSSIDAYIAPFEAELVPAAINQRRVGGEIYSMPVTNEAKFLYYNADILERGGYSAPPESWEEANRVAADLKEKGLVRYGHIWGWHQAEGLVCDYTLLVNGFGGVLADEEGRWLADEENCLRALEFMVDQLRSGAADPASTSLSDREVVDSFAAGEHALLLNWSFAYGVLNNPESSNVSGQIQVGLIPGFEAAGTRSTTVLGGSGLAVTASSPSPDWAWDLIRYITDKPRQIETFTIRSLVPVWSELYDSPEVVAQHPYIKQMEQQYDYASWRPNTPNYAEASGILQIQIHQALNGTVSAEHALAETRSRIASL